VLEQQFLFVGASNTEIAGGGMRIAPGARIRDGLLNINLIGAMNRWAALKQLGRLCRGQHTRHPKVKYLTARTLSIESASSLEVAADGELIGHTPAMVSVRPNCLAVLTPIPSA
jgi:diacylglycerol kinase family enzyme